MYKKGLSSSILVVEPDVKVATPAMSLQKLWEFSPAKNVKIKPDIPSEQKHCNYPKFSPTWPILPILRFNLVQPPQITALFGVPLPLCSRMEHPMDQCRGPMALKAFVCWRGHDRRKTLSSPRRFSPQCLPKAVVATTVITIHPIMFLRDFHHLHAMLQCYIHLVVGFTYLLTYLLACLLTYLLAYSFTCLFACLLTYFIFFLSALRCFPLFQVSLSILTLVVSSLLY